MPTGSPTGPSGNDWWVVPEGFLGKLTNAFSNRGVTFNLFTVKQSATKPAGATAGPYNTQAEAQSVADQLNQGETPTIGNTINKGAAAATSAISKATLGPLFQGNIWIRAGEVIVGLILLAIGLARITHAVPIATKVAKTVGAVGLV